MIGGSPLEKRKGGDRLRENVQRRRGSPRFMSLEVESFCLFPRRIKCEIILCDQKVKACNHTGPIGVFSPRETGRKGIHAYCASS